MTQPGALRAPTGGAGGSRSLDVWDGSSTSGPLATFSAPPPRSPFFLRCECCGLLERACAAGAGRLLAVALTCRTSEEVEQQGVGDFYLRLRSASPSVALVVKWR